MRRTVLGLLLLAILAIGSAAYGAPESPFTGAWEAIDLDGSHMTLTISGQESSVQFAFKDDSAGLCLNQGAPTGQATILGTGTVTGATLVTSFDHIRCTGGIVIETPDSSHRYTYHADTDTLSVDFDEAPGDETIWYRVNSPAA